MGFLDSLKQAAGDGQEPHAAFHGLLEKTPLGGLEGLLDELHEGGLHEAVTAWEEGDEHPPISADEIKEALGEEHLQHVATALGVAPDEAAQHLCEHLPALAEAHAASDVAGEDRGEPSGHEDDRVTEISDEPTA